MALCAGQVTRGACRGVPKACALSDGKELSRLDLFDPDDGRFEHSAIVTSQEVTGRMLRYFMRGRDIHEKVYGGLKGASHSIDCRPRAITPIALGRCSESSPPICGKRACRRNGNRISEAMRRQIQLSPGGAGDLVAAGDVHGVEKALRPGA